MEYFIENRTVSQQEPTIRLIPQTTKIKSIYERECRLSETASFDSLPITYTHTSFYMQTCTFECKSKFPRNPRHEIYALARKADTEPGKLFVFEQFENLPLRNRTYNIYRPLCR